MARRTLRSSVLLPGALVLAACTSRGGHDRVESSSPSPPPRTIAACSADVEVPADRSDAAPAATDPPTAVLAVGDALAFAAPTAAGVGFVGASVPGEADTLCRATGARPGSVVLVARNPGYVHIGVQLGSARPAVILVKITP